eukprot:COSAG02_NODE_122_length_35306_cov_98.280967_6_plen_116_part_00
MYAESRTGIPCRTLRGPSVNGGAPVPGGGRRRARLSSTPARRDAVRKGVDGRSLLLLYPARRRGRRGDSVRPRRHRCWNHRRSAFARTERVKAQQTVGDKNGLGITTFEQLLKHR